jgi:ribosomal-protein-alanine N-acetyltransferase
MATSGWPFCVNTGTSTAHQPQQNNTQHTQHGQYTHHGQHDGRHHTAVFAPTPVGAFVVNPAPSQTTTVLKSHSFCDDAAVTITLEPWSSPAISVQRVQLVHLPATVVHALAGDDKHHSVEMMSGHLTPYIRGSECQGLWRHRSAQIADRPSDSAWITRLIVTPGVTGAVGVAGFHGPPDDRQMVEFGYRVDPQYRRQGYARAALETLLLVARCHPGVSVVRASVSPANAASRSLIDQYGFVEVGEQWDEEDGAEILFEVGAE